MLIKGTYTVVSGTTFDIEYSPAAADGKRYPLAVVIHGNFGLVDPFGTELRKFAEQLAALGYFVGLPSYYPAGFKDKTDTNIDARAPALAAAIKFLSGCAGCDASRLGIVGFSLGGGIAASYIDSAPAGTVKVFADFYGYVGPTLAGGVAKFPPTIVFNNNKDPFVPVKEHSKPLADALGIAGIIHEEHWYDDNWPEGGFHAFEPGKAADLDSRDRTQKWFGNYMPAKGV